MNTGTWLVVLVVFGCLEISYGLDPVLAMKCQKETGANLMRLQKGMHDQDISDFTEQDQCFIKCFMMDLKWMLPDGTITNTGFAKLAPQLEKHYDACKDVADENLCLRAYNFHKCLFEEDKKSH